MGKRFKVNEYAVIRQWRGEAYQQLSYFPGARRNFRNPSAKCLDVQNGDREYASIIFQHCHNGANQGWFLDRRGVHYPRYPLRNGVRFQIKTAMRSRRALLYTEHIGSHQYRLRIRNNNPYNTKQWWIFDYRTKTIRAASNRNFVISVQKGGTNWRYYHYAGVVYRYTGHMLQKMRWYNSNRKTIRDVSNRCLDVVGNSDSHNRHTQWYKCHNGLNQGWLIDRKGYNYPVFPIRSGVRFQIKIRMKYTRPIYWAQRTS